MSWEFTSLLLQYLYLQWTDCLNSYFFTLFLQIVYFSVRHPDYWWLKTWSLQHCLFNRDQRPRDMAHELQLIIMFTAIQTTSTMPTSIQTQPSFIVCMNKAVLTFIVLFLVSGIKDCSAFGSFAILITNHCNHWTF